MSDLYWDADRLATLFEILGHGGTYTDVAVAIGCPKNSVASKVSRLREKRDPRLPDRLKQPDARYQRNMSGKTGGCRVQPSSVHSAPDPIAPRDPCFRCGVRRDVGCIHTAHERMAA